MSRPRLRRGLLRCRKKGEPYQVEEIQGGNPACSHPETQSRRGEWIEWIENCLRPVRRRFKRDFQCEKQRLLSGHFHIKESDHRGFLRLCLIPPVAQFWILEQRPELCLGQFHSVHNFGRKNPVRQVFGDKINPHDLVDRKRSQRVPVGNDDFFPGENPGGMKFI